MAFKDKKKKRVHLNDLRERQKESAHHFMRWRKIKRVSIRGDAQSANEIAYLVKIHRNFYYVCVFICMINERLIKIYCLLASIRSHIVAALTPLISAVEEIYAMMKLVMQKKKKKKRWNGLCYDIY